MSQRFEMQMRHISLKTQVLWHCDGESGDESYQFTGRKHALYRYAGQWTIHRCLLSPAPSLCSGLYLPPRSHTSWKNQSKVVKHYVTETAKLCVFLTLVF